MKISDGRQKKLLGREGSRRRKKEEEGKRGKGVCRKLRENVYRTSY